MQNEIISAFENSPIIIAIKDDDDLSACLSCDKKVVFVLYGSVITIPAIVARLKEADKAVFVDIDLLDGLSALEAAVDYLARSTAADGIVSTKAPLVRRAAALGLATVYRTFLLDSMALRSLQKTAVQSGADFVEILPGVMPKLIGRLAAALEKPLIASGLLADKEDVIAALSAGAAAISSTDRAVWEL